MDSRTVFLIVIAAAVLVVLVARLRPKKAPSSIVSEKIRAGAGIVDVRTPPEFAASSYPRAKNIPLDQLPSRMGDLPKEKPLVLYCASGARSARAVRILKRAGFTDVVSAGGLADMPR
jgi:phage shock protein E